MGNKRKRRGLPIAKKDGGFDQFNELRPLINRKNRFADISGWSMQKCQRKTGDHGTVFNYICNKDGYILVNMDTAEDSADRTSSTYNRKCRFRNE
jgi:hypothetical protein